MTTGKYSYEGIPTNVAPAAGFLGELLTGTQSMAVSIPNSTVATTNITSVTLTPGVWDITGTVTFAASVNCSGATSFNGVLSPTSGSFVQIDSQSNFGQVGTTAGPITNGGGQPLVCTMGPARVTISANTTYFLNAWRFESGATGVITATGYMRGTRVG